MNSGTRYAHRGAVFQAVLDVDVEHLDVEHLDPLAFHRIRNGFEVFVRAGL